MSDFCKSGHISRSAYINLLVVSGHKPAVMFPTNDFGPIKLSLIVPPAMIEYVISHSSPLISTMAIPFATEAVPKIQI